MLRGACTIMKGMVNTVAEKSKYKRVLLKLSGEALAGHGGSCVDPEMLAKVAKTLKATAEAGIELALIVGAGNIWRGRQGGDMDRVKADHMGMLATVINALALADALRAAGAAAHVMSATLLEGFAERYDRDAALAAMKRGDIVIFAGGLGIPFVSTDTAAAVRGAEIGADVLMFAKNIDGVYSADPKKDPNAVHYDHVTYDFVLEHELGVMDQTAASFCRENDLEILMFALSTPENILDALCGRVRGTVLTRN